MKETDRKRSPTPEFLSRMGLMEGCNLADVTEAYHRRARSTHPDHGGSKEDFQLLCDDYEKAKRYVHGPHTLKSPNLPATNAAGLNPSANLAKLSEAKRFAIARRLGPVLTGTIIGSVTSIFGIAGGTLPIGLTVMSLLGTALCLVYLAASELPRLPAQLAAISFAVIWLFLTALMILMIPEIKYGLEHPEEPNSALLPLLLIFCYVLVTFFGLLGALASLTNKR